MGFGWILHSMLNENDQSLIPVGLAPLKKKMTFLDNLSSDKCIEHAQKEKWSKFL